MVLIQEGFQGGSPGAFQGRPAFLTRWPWRRWRVEGGVQTQSGDEGHRFAQGLAAVEQIQHGVAVVSHQYRGTLGQPATSASGGHDHLPGPVGDPLVPASLLLVVPRGRRQHGEHRQSPVASRPRDVAQPHQGDPASAYGGLALTS